MKYWGLYSESLHKSISKSEVSISLKWMSEILILIRFPFIVLPLFEDVYLVYKDD